jgi:broad specificity phosphatase PhoE
MMHMYWIYLCVLWRFFGWRMRLWLHPEQLGRTKLESIHTHMKQTLLIVRHGQTTWNVEHRLPGQLAGVSLNDNGRQQAMRLAEALNVIPISAIISSPLERAYHTAEYLAEGRNLEIYKEPDLMDTNIGSWAGQVIADLSKSDPAWSAYVKDPTVAPEGVETFPQVQQRVVAAVESWRMKENIGAYPLFVAHADVIKLLLAYYTGLDVSRAGNLFIDNASVSLVEFEKDQPPHIVSIGWSPKPGWLKLPIPEEQKPAEANPEAGEQKS